MRKVDCTESTIDTDIIYLFIYGVDIPHEETRLKLCSKTTRIVVEFESAPEKHSAMFGGGEVKFSAMEGGRVSLLDCGKLDDSAFYRFWVYFYAVGTRI
jgi:hypothetical protein